MALINPTVHASPMKNVLTAVGQPPHLFSLLKLTETNRTALLRRLEQHGARELHYREQVPVHNGTGGQGNEFGHRDYIYAYAGAGAATGLLEEVEEAEDIGGEGFEKTQKGDCVDEDVWKVELCESNWEAHQISLLNEEKNSFME
ncbi:hypothetical protein Dimus_028963 [Dionaea muscipula]